MVYRGVMFISRMLGCSQSTVDNMRDKIGLSPMKTRAGHRRYSPYEVNQLRDEWISRKSGGFMKVIKAMKAIK